MRVDYVEGNRDFFLAGGPYADAFDTVGREVAFRAGGVRYLAVHGDGLDARDWKYRFWRRASKSWPSRLVVSKTPRRLARWLVDSTERSLAKTNVEHKRHIPRQRAVRLRPPAPRRGARRPPPRPLPRGAPLAAG